MRFVLNGQPEELAESCTIDRFIAAKGFNPASVIVEHNYAVVKKEAWATTVLSENDNLEILRLVGGG